MLSQAFAVEKFEKGSGDAKEFDGVTGDTVSADDSVACDSVSLVAEGAVVDDWASGAGAGAGGGGKSSAKTRVGFGARPSQGKIGSG